MASKRTVSPGTLKMLDRLYPGVKPSPEVPELHFTIGQWTHTHRHGADESYRRRLYMMAMEELYIGSSGSGTGPPAPTSLAAAFAPTSITLTWNASAGATSYNLYRGTSSGGETLLASGVTSPYPDTTAVPGNTYYYEAKAIGPGGTSPASNEVTAQYSSLFANLQEYYAFSAGAFLLDSTGTANLTNNAGVTQSTSGIVGDCASFAAASSQFLNNTNFNASKFNTAGTINLWANPNGAQATNARLIEIGDTTNRLAVFFPNGTTVVVGNATTNVSPAFSVSSGTWVMLTATWSGSTLNLYANGNSTPVATASFTIPTFASVANIVLGQYVGGGFFYNGLEDEIGLWSTALTTTQIGHLYGGGTPPTYPFPGVP